MPTGRAFVLAWASIVACGGSTKPAPAAPTSQPDAAVGVGGAISPSPGGGGSSVGAGGSGGAGAGAPGTGGSRDAAVAVDAAAAGKAAFDGGASDVVTGSDAGDVAVPAAPRAGETWRLSADFGGFQGSRQWYYRAWNGASCSDLAFANDTWSGSSVRIQRQAFEPGDAAEAALVWKAPADMDVQIDCNLQRPSVAGDGSHLRIVRRRAGAVTQIWPDRGDQLILPSQTLSLRAAAQVNAGDETIFHGTKGATTDGDPISCHPRRHTASALGRYSQRDRHEHGDGERRQGQP